MRSVRVLNPPPGVSATFWRLLTEEALAEQTVLDVGTGTGRVALVLAHLCMSEAIVARAGRALGAGRVFAFVAFQTDQWKETGRASRFAYDEDRARRVLAEAGFAVEHLEVESEVRTFGSVEEALAAVIGLGERWKADGRWFHY